MQSWISIFRAKMEHRFKTTLESLPLNEFIKKAMHSIVHKGHIIKPIKSLKQKAKYRRNIHLINWYHVLLQFCTQWIQSFFNSFASTTLAISAKLLLKYPLTTFVKAKTWNIHLLFSNFLDLPILYYVVHHFAARGLKI